MGRVTGLGGGQKLTTGSVMDDQRICWPSTDTHSPGSNIHQAPKPPNSRQNRQQITHISRKPPCLLIFISNVSFTYFMILSRVLVSPVCMWSGAGDQDVLVKINISVWAYFNLDSCLCVDSKHLEFALVEDSRGDRPTDRHEGYIFTEMSAHIMKTIHLRPQLSNGTRYNGTRVLGIYR